jgi:LL-diaminopimelate aminotransferase
MNGRLPFAGRIGGEDFTGCGPSYKFSPISMRGRDGNQLDLGIGLPMEAPPAAAVERLREMASIAANHRYTDCGCREFLEGAAQYMEHTFAVAVQPETEILPSLGIKNALTYLALAFLNPGNVALVTVPGYPVFPTHAAYLGAEVFSLPLRWENQFFPDFEGIPREVLRRAKVLLLNYPNNPTGARATVEFFQRAINFAARNGILLIHDAAYAGLCNDHFPPLSILGVPGAMETCIELHSCSKSHHMTGWRIGWVCGCRGAISAYRRIKENSDSGQFLPIQMGASAALADMNFPRDSTNRLFSRWEATGAVLREKGFKIFTGHPFYIYAQSPDSVDGLPLPTAQAFSDWAMEHLNVITVPWDDVGHHVRFSMTIPLPPATLAMSLRERLMDHTIGYKV